MIDTARDREIVEAATDEEWFLHSDIDTYDEWNRSDVMTSDKWMIASLNKMREEYDGNGKFISHFNPQYAKELLDAVDERYALREAMEDIRAACNRYGYASDIAEIIDSMDILPQPDQEQEVCGE